MQGRSPQANLPEGNSILPTMGLRRRVSLRSPVRKNCTPGSVRGASGNRRPYRDDQSAWYEPIHIIQATQRCVSAKRCVSAGTSIRGLHGGCFASIVTGLPPVVLEHPSHYTGSFRTRDCL